MSDRLNIESFNVEVVAFATFGEEIVLRTWKKPVNVVLTVFRVSQGTLNINIYINQYALEIKHSGNPPPKSL